MRNFAAAVLVVLLGALSWLNGCGNSDDEPFPGQPGGVNPAGDPPVATPASPSPASDAPGTTPAGGNANTEVLSDFSLNCKDGSPVQQQQQQVLFSKDASCVHPTPQAFQFQQSRIPKFDFVLDCRSQVIVAKSKGTVHVQQHSFPIQSGGKVKGQMQIQEQLASDGFDVTSCFSTFVIIIDGFADCRKEALELDTKVEFVQSSDVLLQEAGIAVQGSTDFHERSGSDDHRGETPPDLAPTPNPTPTPEPEPQRSPRASNSGPGGPGSPGEFPSEDEDPEDPEVPELFPPIIHPTTVPPFPHPSVTVSPSPTVTVSPSPRPTVTVTHVPIPVPTVIITTPVRFCIVENPCPLHAKTELACDAQQAPGS